MLDNYQMCSKLINAGADVNAINSDKQTPLHIAAVKGKWIRMQIRLKIMKLCPDTELDIAKVKDSQNAVSHTSVLWTNSSFR